jgi:DNA-binding LytR/AlgR family response regulator
MNRQYLVNFSAIREAEHYFSRKLLVKLSVPTEEKLLVGKEKVTAFLSWLENR